jgi:flavin reductase (DIM6/NTAB) family NADH-FMN oxidoreductase RutF
VSRSLGPALPGDLLRALSQTDLGARLGRALPLLTVDDAGRPHPMLCTYVEILAVSPESLRLVVGAGSGSARNLEARGAVTLLLIEPERTVYVKGRAGGAPLVAEPFARFTLAVEDVLEDSALEWEGGARITSGIVYAPALEAPEVQATLALLRREVRPPADPRR